MTCAALDLLGIARTKLLFWQVVSRKYLKSLNPFGINLMSIDKLSIGKN